MRLELATAWVEEAAGVRPVSFRAPRLFGSTAMIQALEALGCVSDGGYPMYFLRERLAPSIAYGLDASRGLGPCRTARFR